MSPTPFAPERIVAALNASDVAHVIVGGLAVAAHGVVRATGDLDLVRMPAVAPYQHLRATALSVDLGVGAIAPVCSLAGLRVVKLASGRPAISSTLPNSTNFTAAHSCVISLHAASAREPRRRRASRRRRPRARRC